jgi:Protein of unknown function (DUF2924)/Resolvase, N terminal domain
VKNATTKPVRCAIYTRVSTDHGLEQDFNSLDAQHDAAQAYIRSQAHAGWTLIRARYDDGGYSGGSTDRPALQRLLFDLKAGKIDVIVVYKVDRLTRSLADFAKLVELFDGQLLFRILAYRLQADRLGDLDADSRRLLDRIGSGSADGIDWLVADLNRSRTELRPGTLLTREWDGHLQRVMVLADGFAWNGKTYRSLSKVAFAMTGTRWSGPRFFGLDQPPSERRP